jgi:hypothetical protein
MCVELKLEVRWFDIFIKVFVRNIFLIDSSIDRDMTISSIRLDLAQPNLVEPVQNSINDYDRCDRTLINKSNQL